MATVLAGQLYDRVMRWQHQAAGGDCIGPDCFRYTFLICGGLAALATVLAALLWRRTGRKYQTIIKVRSGAVGCCKGAGHTLRRGDSKFRRLN